mmetsp:Transcript_428/g.1941  ORF Transcript_428/g.1941 Transcript_428/m.1941 type:complete len:208 (+) Transcript_428:1363-1986(+)
MPVDAQFSKMTTAHTVSNSFDFTTFARIPGCLMVISSAICDSTELQRRFLHSPGSTTSSVGPTHVFCVSPLPRLAELPALSCEEVQLRGLRKDLGISRGLLGNSVFLLGTRRWHLLWFRLRNVGHLATRNVSDLWRHCQGVIVLSRGTFEVRYHCQHEVVVLRIEGEVLLGEGVRALGHHGCGHGWAPDDLPTLPGALALQRLQFPA